MEVSRIVLLEFNWGCFLVLVDVVAQQFFSQNLDLFFIFIGEDRFILFGFLLICLDFDSGFGNKWLERNFLGNVDNMLRISDQGKVEHAGIDIGSSLDKFNVDRVIEVELESSWSSLQSTPERFASILDNVGFREC